ncbi:MFS transporter [archaeon]|nr:MFS transporter [archaeon]
MDWHHLHIHFGLLARHMSHRREIYANRLLQQLALSLVGIFIPVYLLNLNYSIVEVMAFLGVYYGFMCCLSFVGAFSESRIGEKHTIALTIPLFILFFLLLFSLEFLEGGMLTLAFIAGVYALAQQLYWQPTNTEFACCSNKKSRGKEISYLYTFPQFAALVAPLLGAGVLAYYGFDTLFLLVGVILVLSIIPLFFSADKKPKLDYEWKKVFSIKNLDLFDAYSAQGVLYSSIAFLWPVYIFYLVDGNILLVGAAGSAIALGVACFTLIVGRLTDKFSKTKLIQAGGLLLFLSMLGALFVGYIPSTLNLLIVSLAIGFTSALVDIPLYAKTCDEANKENPAEFMVFRTTGLASGAVLNLSAIIVLVTLLAQTGLQYAFLLPMVASIYFLMGKV